MIPYLLLCATPDDACPPVLQLKIIYRMVDTFLAPFSCGIDRLERGVSTLTHNFEYKEHQEGPCIGDFTIVIRTWSGGSHRLGYQPHTTNGDMFETAF